MNPNLTFLTYPIGAGMAQGEQRWAEISELVNNTPQTILDMVASPQTASYIRGVAKAHQLTAEQSYTIAYAVLRVALGEKRLAELSSILSSELAIANDKANQIAQELEHDLFAPIAIELNRHADQRRQEVKKLENKATGNPRAAGATNVLDLKQQPQPPRPPAIPRPPQIPRRTLPPNPNF